MSSPRIYTSPYPPVEVPTTPIFETVLAHAVDQAIQTHGGNGLSQEYGVAALLTMSRVSRIAPVSREMILSFVAQHDLQLPRSY